MIVCPFKDLNRYCAIIPGVEEAIAKINALQTLEPGTYPLENGRFVVSHGTTKSTDHAQCEAHRQYLDIQYIVKGQEVMGWAPLDTLTPAGEFNTEKDVGKYTGAVDFVRIGEGYCYVVFPEDGHMPARHLDTPNDFTKIVIKLEV